MGMCSVGGQVLNIRMVSTASIPVTDSSSRITSGTWQEALTIASKPVRATATRNPAVLSCASRTSRDTASPSAINTSGALPLASAGDRATTGGVCVVVRDTGVAFRCTANAGAKMLPICFAARGPRLVRLLGFAATARQALADSKDPAIQKAQRFKDSAISKIQRFEDSAIRGFRDQGFKDQGFKDQGFTI